MSPVIETLQLNINGQSVTGIRQRDADQTELPRMLCVHGWLDNANSFIPLMPYLPSFDIVSIDLPGHGYSDHLPGGYTLHEMTYQLHLIRNALGWDKCHLVGHSLGAGIVPLLAVAEPEAVQSLIIIESSGPLSEAASALPERMKRALNDRVNSTDFESRTYATKGDAVAVRLRAAKMQKASAQLIIDRQLQKTADGFKWRFDNRWRMASPQYQTEEQVQAILAAISCPVLTVVADDGYLVGRPTTEARFQCIKDRQHILLAGNHHIHMDTPEPVAAAINRFLKAKPDMGG